MTCARRARAVVFVVLACSGVMHENGALAQHRDSAGGLDSPRGPSGRRRAEHARPPATTPPATAPPATSPPATSPPATSPPATSPPATSPPVTSPPRAVLPLPPDATAPQSIVALDALSGSARAGDAHHFEDGEADELPWPDPIRASMPLGSPHFVLELSGGFLAPLLEAQPYVQLVLGIEAYTGVLRLRAMVGVAFEEVVESPPMMWSSSDARQGGLYPMVRFTMGGDAAPWLAIRVAVGTGVVIWSDIYPTFDGALEIAARLTDERRLELGISGGPSMRYVSRPSTGPGLAYDRSGIELGARIALFLGGVL